MATVNFLYRSTKDKANLVLRLLYRFNDTDFVFGANTKFETTKEYWSKQHKKKSKDINITNEQTRVTTELNKIENHVLKAFDSVSPKEVNKKWLQTQIDYYYNPPQQSEDIPTNLVDYIEYYKVARRHDLKPVMIRRCNVIKNKLEKYENDNKTKILIENVNDNFRNAFLDFQFKQKYSLSTIRRELVFIKTICTHAKKKGLIVSLELEDFSKEIKRDNLENANKTFVYLNDNDLKKLENINPNRLTKTLEDVKNWLLISCYIGQRISDFMRFDTSMIRVQNNIKYIDFTQVKTGHKVSIPLDSKILRILEDNNNQFPKPISDVKYNEYVKEVCRIAKIDDVITGGKVSNLGTEKNPIWRKEVKEYKKYELVSSHIGRRSFATNNFGKIPTSILKTLTGHKTEKMLLNYVGKSENDMLEEISKYFK
ncbi:MULTISPECIES: tyrosine-type recombinase/integrase [Flavobacterium]|uniref:tyrosine-type recombinase/integrase n=1 Tax=Flavobacterium TaxID=237 RepID=UPI001FCBD9D6|nr:MULTISPECIES: tyrosine-type recombinase/integrase [Flavobacterium]UOK41641.1 tyrosine-type recombinase/integrase [Flavobacterium enshiense]